jgi:hypothetical protein
LDIDVDGSDALGEVFVDSGEEIAAIAELVANYAAVHTFPLISHFEGLEDIGQPRVVEQNAVSKAVDGGPYQYIPLDVAGEARGLLEAVVGLDEAEAVCQGISKVADNVEQRLEVDPRPCAGPGIAVDERLLSPVDDVDK